MKNSPYCNYKGDLVCGICVCSGTNVGRKCECDAPGQSTAALDAKCKRFESGWWWFRSNIVDISVRTRVPSVKDAVFVIAANANVLVAR